jgi:hypothetical protein
VDSVAFVNHHTTSLIKMELTNLIRRFAYATQGCLEPLLKMRATPETQSDDLAERFRFPAQGSVERVQQQVEVYL